MDKAGRFLRPLQKTLGHLRIGTEFSPAGKISGIRNPIQLIAKGFVHGAALFKILANLPISPDSELQSRRRFCQWGYSPKYRIKAGGDLNPHAHLSAPPTQSLARSGGIRREISLCSYATDVGVYLVFLFLFWRYERSRRNCPE